MKKLKVLFINHESSRSGAPLLILNFIKWLVEHDLVEPIILTNLSGILDNEFKDLGKTYFYYRTKSSAGRGIIYKLYCRFHNSNLGKSFYLARLRKKISTEGPQLIYSNTICNGEILHFCNFLKLKVLTHIHEGLYVMNLMGDANLRHVIKYTTHFIVCSDMVKRDLQTLDVKDINISVVYSSISSDVTKQNQSLNNATISEAIKKNLFIIGGSGGFGWIKGTDMIVPLVKEIKKYRKDFLFVWVGGDLNSYELKQLKFEIAVSGLIENIYFTGLVDDPVPIFTHFEVFTLLSRTDSFPLVCLENAILGNPFVAFKDCTGVEILLQNGLEENLIPYGDVHEMAKRIVQFFGDQQLKIKIGTVLRSQVLEKYTHEICFPQLLSNLIELK